MNYIPGADELMEKLRRLARKDLKKVISKAARPSAKIIQPEAAALAPRGKTGVLHVSIKVRALKRSRRFAGAQVTMQVEGSSAYYGGFVELGTKRQKGQGFIKRAFARGAVSAGRVMLDGIAEGINNVVRH